MADINTKEFENTKFEAFKRGTSIKKIFGTIEKTADIKNDDKLIIAHDLSVDCVIHSIKITSGAMEGFAGAKLIALKSGSKKIIKNGNNDFSFADSITFAAAKSSVDIFPQNYKNNSLRNILDIKGGGCSYVDLALISSTVGTATGSIYVEIEFSSPF